MPNFIRSAHILALAFLLPLLPTDSDRTRISQIVEQFCKDTLGAKYSTLWRACIYFASSFRCNNIAGR